MDRYVLIVLGGDRLVAGVGTTQLGTTQLGTTQLGATQLGATQLGARVLLIEKKALGGDCLYTGCVPPDVVILFD